MILKFVLPIDLVHFAQNCVQIYAMGPHYYYIKIGSGNGLVPLGNKPLHENNVDQVIWHYMASAGHNQ